MSTLTMAPSPTATPTLLRVSGGLGLAWNLYGLYQFATGFTAPGRASMTAGMSPAQAELYLSLPVWITLVFAVGVLGGLAGSLALLMRRRIALPIFSASLAGYLLLFAGDVYYGVFAAIPAQLAILAFVVAVAAALLGTTWLANRRGQLR
jgi:hypothetical protein